MGTSEDSGGCDAVLSCLTGVGGTFVGVAGDFCDEGILKKDAILGCAWTELECNRETETDRRNRPLLSSTSLPPLSLSSSPSPFALLPSPHFCDAG